MRNLVQLPLDRDAVKRTLAPLGENRMLPRDAYISPGVLAWEMEHFFEGAWVCLGRTDDLHQPGDQRAFRVGGESILLVRDQDLVLRGFYNVCRHRGHELLECGDARSLHAIKCPYHAWVYGLDGDLKGAPRFGEVPGFDRADHPLIPARVHEWGGWVFANASGDAPEFADYVGNLRDLVRPWEPERTLALQAHEYEVAANWKIICENYHECYHCPSIHPELCEVTPPDSGQSYEATGAWTGGDMDLKDFAETMSLTGGTKGTVFRGLDAVQRRKVYYFNLLPNMLISLHPDYVMTHRIEPLEPGRTRVECQWLFAPEARDREGFDPDYADEFWDITNREDWRACESVQRGVASRAFRPGPLAAQEDTLQRFESLVAKGYLAGRITTPSPQTQGVTVGISSG